MSVNTAFVLDVKVGLVQDTVPPAPIEGVVQVQPLGALSDWNVVPAGSGSVSVALVASTGPALLAGSVWVRLRPPLTGVGGGALVRLRCAAWLVLVRRTLTVPLPWFATAKSGLPSPLKSPTATELGRGPAP